MQYIKTFAQAEQNAARQMRALGYTDARVTPPGPDGGIDVLSSTAVAQVKWRGAQVSRPDLHRLYGARGGRHHLDMLFFAATNYSGPAIQYANEVDIALFVYFPTGELDPVNRSAQRLVAKARNRSTPADERGLEPQQTTPMPLPSQPPRQRRNVLMPGCCARKNG
ncbi:MULTISPECIES: restriction endonuclease [Nocardia]|uniref:restriction endonuclease n=1 Tax=Nocardia TaxID=1817 RepID=UPI003CC7E5C3